MPGLGAGDHLGDTEHMCHPRPPPLPCSASRLGAELGSLGQNMFRPGVGGSPCAHRATVPGLRHGVPGPAPLAPAAAPPTAELGLAQSSAHRAALWHGDCHRAPGSLRPALALEPRPWACRSSAEALGRSWGWPRPPPPAARPPIPRPCLRPLSLCTGASRRPPPPPLPCASVTEPAAPSGAKGLPLLGWGGDLSSRGGGSGPLRTQPLEVSASVLRQPPAGAW